MLFIMHKVSYLNVCQGNQNIQDKNKGFMSLRKDLLWEVKSEGVLSSGTFSVTD